MALDHRTVQLKSKHFWREILQVLATVAKPLAAAQNEGIHCMGMLKHDMGWVNTL